MDALSGAASVIAVVDMSAKVASLCYQYSVEVKHAKDDIERLHRKVNDTKNVLEKLRQLEQNNPQLCTTQNVVNSLNGCHGQLQELEDRLKPSRRRKTMAQFGIRALKWPFTSKEVEKTIKNIESHQNTFNLALHIDHTALTLRVDRKTDRLLLPIAKGASFDSHTEEHNARCLPNTRTELLKTIEQWANDKDSKTIFWLCGMAGTGKSTIARTVAQRFAEGGQLGASFFFKKGEGERGNASRFFSTIATDLAAREPGMISGLRKALDEDSALPQKALKDQFEKLILHPLSDVSQTHSTTLTYVVVIDALDECEREEDIRAILQLLTQTKDMQPVSLRVLVTSRPELHIRLGFKQMPSGIYQDLILHEVAKNTIEHDIRLFYEHELGQIRQARELPPDWPTTNQIKALVELAVPLFIFAATVCRYIGTKGGHPEGYLDKVLAYQKSTFSQLDRTYLPVLEQLLVEQEEDEREDWLQSFRKVVGSIVVLESPLSIGSLAHLLQIPQKELKCRLDALHSILNIPDSYDIPVRLLHLSFRDFLLDRQRQAKSHFWVDARDTHKNLTSCCLELMRGVDGLRENICAMSGPGVFRSEIDDDMITKNLPPQLEYACRYWVSHLEQSQQKICDGDFTHLFLQTHLLHWFEAMSLLRESSQCVRLLSRLQTLAAPSASIVSSFLEDAKRFILRFQSIISDAPLQLYHSALLFAPQASMIRQTFENQIPPELKLLSGGETHWDACRSTLEGHTGIIFAVAFSPDGKLVASASDDGTVRLWEVETGALCSTLHGFNDRFYAVAFSLDGKLIASGSQDGIVWLWEVETGMLSRALNFDTTYVSAVIFLPDGELVASASSSGIVWLWEVETGALRSWFKTLPIGYLSHPLAFSSDGKLVGSVHDTTTVQLWEVETGALNCTLDSRTNNVMAVSLSPDGKLFASTSGSTVYLNEVETGGLCSALEGSPGALERAALSVGNLLASGTSDGTVRLWEIGEETRTVSVLEGHTGYVRTVAFSPDGKLFASGAQDRTVRLWEVGAETRALRSALVGHDDEVRDVAFSPDGKLVASASGDRTMRLWEVGPEKIALRSTLKGHADDVVAVAFSPDGKLLASSSYDYTVRLWETEAETEVGALRSTLEGHTDWVIAVAFSPDGKLVASGSFDYTVRLWEVETETEAGALRSTLEGHTNRVNAVAFSPDGKFIASGSYDNIVRLWEVETGIHCSTLHVKTTKIAFSPDGNHLQTDEGSIAIPSPNIPSALVPYSHLPQISITDNWISAGQQRLLRLPPEYRPSCSAVYKDLVCLGHPSGRMTFLKLPKL